MLFLNLTNSTSVAFSSSLDVYELKEPCKNKGGFNNESRSNTSKNNEPSKGEPKEEHDAKYWEEQNRILNEMLDF